MLCGDIRTKMVEHQIISGRWM